MQKIACLFSFRKSTWVSCQKIVFNLHKSYALDKNLEILNFNYSSESTPGDILLTVHKIYEEAPDAIIILDHKPHPIGILQTLLPLFTEKKPRIIFHVFGDFTLYYPQWDKLAPLLQGFQVDFLVASDRQKHLIDKYLVPPMSAVVCPFPVDKKEFSYQPALRDLQRKEWGLKNEDIAFVFTGRLSRQKRILTLLKAFAECLEKNKIQNAHLFFYGLTDNIGDQFLGRWETEGEYFRQIHRLYKSFPEATQKKIHFMGSVPNKELKSVYQGADYLANLSVHNDEDYGMSVAEAQSSGLPAILTDWGGLAGFEHSEYPEATHYIPVRIGKEAKLIHYPSIVEALEIAVKRGHNIDREKISKLGLGKFGIEAGHKIIRRVLDHKPLPFRGFSPFFSKVIQRFTMGYIVYMTPKKQISKLYKSIYSSYVRNHSESV